MLKTIALSAVLLGFAGICSAQTLYDNTANDDAGFLTNGALDGSGNAVVQNGNIVTNTDFEEVQLAPGYVGMDLSKVSTDLFNSGTNAVTTQVWIQLYDDSSGGAPGNSFFNYDGTVTLGPGLYTGFQFDLTNTSSGDISGDFPLPSDGNLWMSIAFSAPTTGDQLTDNAIGAELDELSPALGGTPTVGSTPGIDTFAYSSNDTNGNGFLFVQNPQQVEWATGANFGFTIDGDTPSGTPEPFTLALGVAGISIAIRRRVKANSGK